MLGVTPLRNGKSHGTLGNLHLLGQARLQTMFNDGGKGSGTSEDLAIEERMRIATEGIIVVDLEVFDAPLVKQTDSDDGASSESAAETAAATATTQKSSKGYLTARARVTSRSMWTDEGRMLAKIRDAAERSVESLGSGARTQRRRAHVRVRGAIRGARVQRQAPGRHRRGAPRVRLAE
jgi:hypothetical protein